MISDSDKEKLDRQYKQDKKKLLKEELEKKLLNNDYSFADPNYEYYEPSSDKPISNDKLTFEALKNYYDKNYHVCDKPSIQREKIEKIIGASRAESFIEVNKSEYFKVLTHFTILSIVKSNWVHLLANSPTTISKPSISNNPSCFALKKSKNLHDSIIRCFYARLIQGMSEQEKERYQILLPEGSLLTGFDELLFMLDKAIQDLLAYEKLILDNDDECLLPDANLDEAIWKTIIYLNHIYVCTVKEVDNTDTLRATLIKCASLNRAINDIDAIINIQNEVIQDLPDDIGQLLHIESESEILPAITDIFNKQETKRKKREPPSDLIECSKLVCKMYINTNQTPVNKDSFNKRNMEPDRIAVSAALLYQNYLQETKINLNISGETNPFVAVYKTLSDLAKKIDSPDILTVGILGKYSFPEEVSKYLTTRYSISVFGLSEFYPSQVGAKAHLRVRSKKLELQKAVYEWLKDMSVEDAYRWIDVLFHCVNHTIQTDWYPFKQ
jgi:hypothetical protein